MRDKERIPQFCNFLALKWERSFPDWRFGQFMINFEKWHWTKYRTDIFYVEDDEMEMRLSEFIEDIGRRY